MLWSSWVWVEIASTDTCCVMEVAGACKARGARAGLGYLNGILPTISQSQVSTLSQQLARAPHSTTHSLPCQSNFSRFLSTESRQRDPSDVTFGTFDQSDEETWPDQKKDNDTYKEKDSDKDKLLTCDIWDTDYNWDNWEPEFMTIFVAWQLRVTLDSIRNSCNVFL